MVFKKLKKIITEQLGSEDDDITLDSRLIDDLGADSIDLVEIVMAVEEEFDIEIPDDEGIELETVGEAVKYIEGKI